MADDILQSVASDEKLTWVPTLPASGGPNAEFRFDAAALPAPVAVPAPAAPPMSDDKSYGPHGGNFEFTLAGSGVSDKRVHNSVANVSGSLGFYLTPAVELAARQDFIWIKSAGHSDTAAASRAALDFHIDLDVLQPFIGANFGYVYGELVKDTFEAAPEAGLKVFVKSDTFLFGMAEYRFFFRHGDDADAAFHDGQWVYSVGVGFTF
ncbi:MAG: hypothetical protein HY292_09375 [Planctomycetes bacterium]|nr:hypothetical protein [Planctomycetota bacterium]